MSFRFENYQTEAAATAQLEQLFPKGAGLAAFDALMHQLGAQCYPFSDEKTGTEQLFCHYTEPGSFVRTKWVVGLDLDTNRTIQKITVKRGSVGT